MAEATHDSYLRDFHVADAALRDALSRAVSARAGLTAIEDRQSYCRLVRPAKTSAGKRTGDTSGKKIGNAHLRWAFSEAIAGLLRDSSEVKRLKTRLEKKYGEGRALSILAARLGRSIYHMLRKREAFDMNRFLGQTEMVVAQ